MPYLAVFKNSLKFLDSDTDADVIENLITSFFVEQYTSGKILIKVDH